MSESSILPLKRGGPENISGHKRHAGRSANLPCGKLSRFRYNKFVPKKNLGKRKFAPFSKLSSDPEILAIQNFIQLCLVVESEKRPTADELLGHIPSHLTDLVTQGLLELTI